MPEDVRPRLSSRDSLRLASSPLRQRLEAALFCFVPLGLGYSALAATIDLVGLALCAASSGAWAARKRAELPQVLAALDRTKSLDFEQLRTRVAEESGLQPLLAAMQEDGLLAPPGEVARLTLSDRGRELAARLIH
jgi:hypothetical protein